MATIEQFQERVRRAVHEALQKILAEGDLPETEQGEARFTTIERLALAAGESPLAGFVVACDRGRIDRAAAGVLTRAGAESSCTTSAPASNCRHGVASSPLALWERVRG